MTNNFNEIHSSGIIKLISNHELLEECAYYSTIQRKSIIQKWHNNMRHYGRKRYEIMITPDWFLWNGKSKLTPKQYDELYTAI